MVEMNPVLASTLEFDQYVKEKLRASRVGIPRSSSNSKGRPSSGDARTTGSNRPNSASIQLRNSQRYHVNDSSVPMTTKNVSSKPSSGNANPPPSPPMFEIAHSWKGHLRPPKEFSIPTAMQDRSRRSNSFVPSSSFSSPPRPPLSRDSFQRPIIDDEEEHHVAQHNDAPPYLELLSDSFSKKISVSSPSPSYYSSHDFPSSASAMSSDNIKVRSFRLKKLFRAWRAHSLREISLLKRWERGVKEQHLEYLLIGCFDSWKFLWLADSFQKFQSRKRIHILLFRWIKRTRQALRWKLIVRHCYLRRSFRKWHELIRAKRDQIRLAAKEKDAITFRDHRLLLRILKAWKRFYRTQKHAKEVEGSRQVTLGRISAFLQRLDSTPDNDNNINTTNTVNNGKQTGKSTEASGTRRSLSTRQSRVSNVSNPLNRNAPLDTATTTTQKVGASTQRPSNASTSRAVSATRQRREASGSAVVDSKSRMKSHIMAVSKIIETSSTRFTDDKDTYHPEMKDSGEDDWAEAEPRQALPKPLTPHKAPLGAYSPTNRTPSIEVHPINSIDTAISAPPSYRHFIGESDAKDSFSLREDKPSHRLSNNETTSDSNSASHDKEVKNDALDQFTSRKDRLAYLQQRAQERVQKRREEMQRQQELKAQQEAETAACLLQEAKRKKQDQQEKSLLHRQEVKQTQAMVHRAESFRRKWLMIHHGLAPWIRYMNRSYRQHQQAVQFANRHLLASTWQLLKIYAHTRKAERIRQEYGQSLMATNHHRRRLLRHIFKQWQLYRKLLRAKARALMGHFSRRTLPKRVFQAWKLAYARSVRSMNARLQRDIIPFANRVVKRYYWQQWLEFLQEKRLSREIEYRSEMKWQAVQSWLRK